jgi:hypothetical protein
VFVFFGAEDFARFAPPIVSELFLHGHDRQDVPIGFGEGNALAFFDRTGKLAIDRQRKRNAPHLAVGEAHISDNALVIGVSEKASQRCYGANAKQLDIADGQG